MNPAPPPSNEAGRSPTPRQIENLDTSSENDLDDFVTLAVQICGTAMALIALVKEQRQWRHTRHEFKHTETWRELSLQSGVLAGSEIFEVTDAAADPRFAEHPAVKAGEIRYFATAALIANEDRQVGALTVFDREPRKLSDEQRAALRSLARRVTHQMELRRLSDRLKQLVRCREFEAELGRVLSGASTLATMFQECGTKLAGFFQRSVGIWLERSNAGELQPVTIATPQDGIAPPARREAEVQAADRRVARIAGGQKPEAPHAAGDLVQPSAGDRDDELIAAFRGFPLVAQNSVLGVLALWGGPPLAPEEVAALDAFSTTLALAIDVRRGAERLGELNRELERRVAERASAAFESERRHRMLLSNLPGMAYRCRNERDWPAVYVSDGALRVIGIEPEALKSGRIKYGDLIHRDDAERVWSTVQAALEQHKPFALEYRVKHAAGEWRWVWEQGRGIESSRGEIVEIEGFITDITARKQGEHQALRTQRLESLGTLAGGVAHDLNNALAPILMGLELLRLEAPVSEQLIDTMMASARRGAEMVRQLLMFARGAEGARQRVQPQHLLAEVERIVRSTFPKSIELRMRRGKDMRAVLGDPTQLHQVLLNLSVNARDAMPKGGVLTLAMENVDIDAPFASSVPEARAGPYVVWKVTDTGTGIPPEILDRIFEPFFTTKPAEHGTGLGLSTVLGIVRGHEGFVRVESHVGHGTTFSVYLPAADVDQPMLAPIVGSTLRGNGEVILVVDDDPAVRHVTQSVLVALDFRVVLAGDGAEALLRAAAYQHEIRIVITDLNMPHLNGIAFAHVIKRMLPGAGIIAASGRLDEHTEREFRAIGVVEVLHKPFGHDQLVAALRAALHGKGPEGKSA